MGIFSTLSIRKSSFLQIQLHDNLNRALSATFIFRINYLRYPPLDLDLYPIWPEVIAKLLKISRLSFEDP